MRICVFSHQRSGSTVLCNLLSQKHNIENLNEWFDHKTFDESLYEKLYTDDYVVKIMASDFLKDVKFEKIPWDLFDHIFVTEREDQTVAMASAYVVTNENNNIKVPFNFEIPKYFFYYWCKNLKKFFYYKKYILEKYKNSTHYYLSDVLKLLAQNDYSGMREIKNNYYERCENLKEFEPKILKLCNTLTNY